MNKQFLTILFIVIGLTSVPYLAHSQFDTFDSINENSNQTKNQIGNSLVTPTMGGVRVIIPEEEIKSTPEAMVEKKSSRPVLFGLATLLLIVIAVVAALALNPFGKSKHHDHKKL